MSTGPLSYLYKKQIARVQKYSAESAKVLERIREEFGPNAGYQGSLAAVHFIEYMEKTGQFADPARYTSYLRDFPLAVPRLRRALEIFVEDQGQSEYEHYFRD
ncbi:MAG TPA: hypothetical protein VK003_06950 [Oceanobacillus sp.]|nr:hypothetical protein [Oceanobacillus sp.]